MLKNFKKKIKGDQQPQPAQQLATKSTSFVPHMTLWEAQNLKIGDLIDHRDNVGRFVEARIVEKEESNLKIHYKGWSTKHDLWCDYNQSLYRFAKYGSISQRNAILRFKNVKIGDYLDINPPMWQHAEVKKIDKTSGQVQLIYEKKDKYHLFWTHLDNTQEIQPFASHSTYSPTQIAGFFSQIFLFFYFYHFLLFLSFLFFFFGLSFACMLCVCCEISKEKHS